MRLRVGTKQAQSQQKNILVWPINKAENALIAELVGIKK